MAIEIWTSPRFSLISNEKTLLYCDWLMRPIWQWCAERAPSLNSHEWTQHPAVNSCRQSSVNNELRPSIATGKHNSLPGHTWMTPFRCRLEMLARATNADPNLLLSRSSFTTLVQMEDEAISVMWKSKEVFSPRLNLRIERLKPLILF